MPRDGEANSDIEMRNEAHGGCPRVEVRPDGLARHRYHADPSARTEPQSKSARGINGAEAKRGAKEKQTDAGLPLGSAKLDSAGRQQAVDGQTEVRGRRAGHGKAHKPHGSEAARTVLRSATEAECEVTRRML